jgi:hypothetical protein
MVCRGSEEFQYQEVCSECRRVHTRTPLSPAGQLIWDSWCSQQYHCRRLGDDIIQADLPKVLNDPKCVKCTLNKNLKWSCVSRLDPHTGMAKACAACVALRASGCTAMGTKPREPSQIEAPPSEAMTGEVARDQMVSLITTAIKTGRFDPSLTTRFG